MPANPLDELSSHGIMRSPMKIVEYVAENRGASAITSVRTTAGADVLTWSTLITGGLGALFAAENGFSIVAEEVL